MATIKQIAHKAGVSPTTVSNVLHGNTEKVSPSTLLHVQEILRSENYTPNMGAIMLARNNSRIIGVIMFMEPRRDETVLEDPFSSTIMGAMESEIRKYGYFMMIHTTSDEAEVVRLAGTWKLDGLILVWVPEATNHIIRKCINRPVVFVDSYFDDDGIAYHNIGLDDERGGYEIARYLLAKGHRSMLFLANDTVATGADRARFDGCRRAFAEQGITLEERSYLPVSKDSVERIRFYGTIADNPSAFGTLVFSADYYAAEAMLFLQDRGIRIPGDISITGFDDNVFSRMVRPGLTTVHQDVYGKGQAAIAMLMKLVKGEQVPEHDVRLPVRLMIRDSVRDRTAG
ncbi:MAG: LacI family transcriptional regulator [Spirochaetae bacterium HGW-Spirochaetae-7]|jgi:LacI family transcriptional regulator|nr:MAG: LacI family transcriptional regulator [Spirochaetae bacterium HGW-Spirochaetae-7]